MPAKTPSETLSWMTTQVIIHPLVLLSVVDAFNRVALNTSKRVVGVLLGQKNGKIVNVANSFVVPFEEDEKDPQVWFLDHNYMESMNEMFKKINVREKMIGWYHTGPKLRSSDIEINELFKKYIPDPLLVIINVKPRTLGIPTDAYFVIEEIRDDDTMTSKTFVHVSSSIEAEEVEEICVEHLLRDIKNAAVGTLSTRITNQLHSLRGLSQRLSEISQYLGKVLDKKLPVNHMILEIMQDIFNLVPNLSSFFPDTKISSIQGNNEKYDPNNDLTKAFRVKTNDQLMCIYLSSIIRCVMSLHDLIDNKIQNKERSNDETDDTLDDKINEKNKGQ
ncbi:proteasome regulatory particle lid subunit RPN8 [Pneumocystis jirovecii RU7]|uniref:MPN domain-containing protein n=1 Tax=Pneumocystis jirovecii (strain RU7) TaxID=1408657 RepID=A0A0W4ZMI2_PNEJ7|nr:proteasome regulatory particle lid subunit RPN8 [Pneumocystis jirovecii RU7]KTW29580.1 hypothetical protein T551_02196 [Pneumocystis jirovecii RU7]